jgi:NTE family protein
LHWYPGMSRSSAFIHRVGLVLAGGGARAAYEVGVIQYLVHDVARALGRDIPLDVLCGTSAGAINACSLAACADAPRERATRLAERWCSLEIEEVLRFDSGEALAMARDLVGMRKLGRGMLGRNARPKGGLFDPAGVRQILGDSIPFDRIGEHLRAGRISAVSVSATHVASGRTVVFAQQSHESLPSWGNDTSVEPRGVTLCANHALASAAIPFLFPAVSIDGAHYCDGALRQNVPLSPARRLGADALIIVSPHHAREGAEFAAAADSAEIEPDFVGPSFLLGKTLNALLLDRMDGDVDRLNRLNQILDAGVREYGPGFIDALNRQLGRKDQKRLRRLESVVIRPSQNISLLAADFMASPRFLRGGGLGRRVFRRLASTSTEADFASYLLFDGRFAAELIELGRSDARAHHDRLVELFDAAIRSRSLHVAAA